MNNVSISGRLVRDPDCKEFDDGKMVCDFTVAVNGYRKDDTVFVKVKAWAARAKSCAQFCRKGSLVNICGSMRGNSWTAKDGTKRREIYVLASDIEFVQLSQEERGSEDNQIQDARDAVTPEKALAPTEEDLETVPF